MNKNLYGLMNWPEIEGIVYAECDKPKELQGKEKDMYDLKHELIASQIKLENTEKNVQDLQREANENAKKIIRLETELKTLIKI